MKKKSTVLSTIIVSLIRKLSLSVCLLGCLSSFISVQAQETEILEALVDEDDVTLEIKVRDEKNRLVGNLKFGDFQVYVDGEDEPIEIDPRNWKNPQQTKSPPAWIIFLLDMSGSMKNPDGGNPDITKLQGAIDAIREFSKAAATRGNDTNVAIVPFAEADDPEICSDGNYPVTSDVLNNFHLAGSEDLELELKKYEDISKRTKKDPKTGKLLNDKLCGSTNLYRPLISAVEFLDDRNNEKFYPPEKSRRAEPRRSIILMSDGYHSVGNDDTYFENLENLLGNNDRIIVHSLGYGLKPNQHGLGRAATRDDVENGLVDAEDFVDVPTLDGIARLTQGFCNVSADSKQVAKALKEFLDDLLGFYEITYLQPNPERGSIHQATVVVNSRHLNKGEDVISEPKSYRTIVFGRRASWEWRLSILGVTLIAVGLGGILPFKLWGNFLKKNG